jgi:hypothetical protein
VLTQPTGKEYSFRFVGSPYNTDEAETRHMLIYTHGRNPSIVSPHSVLALLLKFDITELQFRDAYNEFAPR